MLKRLIRRFKHHQGIYSLAAIILIAGGPVYYFYSYRPNHSADKVVTAGVPVAPSQTVKSQPTPGPKTIPANSSSANNGGAADTHGTSNSTSSSSQWTSSASGVITVKSPAPSSTLKSGDTISGSSSASEVDYRLSDNKVGVIAQGTLSVTNGAFSGVLHFQPQGTGGRLDVFTTDSLGREYNEVQINVAF